MEKKRLCKCCTAGWLLCVIGGISIPVVSYFIKKQVEKTVIIRKGGVLYDLWKDVRFLSTCSSICLMSPIEKREKFNITFNPNGTVSYRQKRIFIFDRSKSVGDDSDVFVTANPLYWTVLAAIKYEYLDINKILELVLKFGGEGPFFEKSVRDLVWGYKDKMLEVGNELAPQWFYTDFVGYFMNKNNTDDGVYTIFTGEKDITMLGMIDKYNGSSYLNFWSTKSANMVNGSDGTLGPPYLSDDRTLYLFASDICRSVSGEWTSNVKIKDISLRRYTAGFMYLANATINPDNIGFCTPESNCMDTGLVNISSCQLIDYFHIPAVVSLPHFYMASDRIKSSIGGLSPSAEEHQTFVDLEHVSHSFDLEHVSHSIDLEHNTGLVLSVAKRLQINLYIQPVEGLPETSKISPSVLPVFWLNETAVVNDKYADQLKRMLFIPKLVVEVVQIAMLSGGALLLLISVFYGVFKLRENQKIESKGKLVVEVVQIAMLSGDALLLLISVFYGIFKLWENQKGESKGKLVVEVVQIAMLSGGALIGYQYSMVYLNLGRIKRIKGKLLVEVVQIAMLSGGALILLISVFYMVYLNYGRMKRVSGRIVQIAMLSGGALLLLISVFYVEENQKNQGKLVVEVVQIAMLLSGGALILLISVFYGLFKLREESKGKLVIQGKLGRIAMLSGGALLLLISVFYGVFKLRRIKVVSRESKGKLVVEVVQIAMLSGGALILLISVFYGKLVVEVVQIAMLSGGALLPTDICILWCFKLRENQKIDLEISVFYGLFKLGNQKGKLVVEVVQIAMLSVGALSYYSMVYLNSVLVVEVVQIAMLSGGLNQYSMVYLNWRIKRRIKGKLVVVVVQIAMLSGDALILLISVFYGIFKLRENQKGKLKVVQIAMLSVGEISVFMVYLNLDRIKNQIAMLSGGALKLVVEVVQISHVVWWCSDPTDIRESKGKLVVEVVQIAMLSGGALILLISVFYGVFKLRENQKIESKGKLVVEVVQIAMLSGGALILLISVFCESKGKLVVEVVQIAMLSGGALILLISVFYGVFKLEGESKGESKGKLVVEVVQITMLSVGALLLLISVFYGVFKLRENQKNQNQGKLVVEVVQIAMLSGGALLLISVFYGVFKLRENQKLVVEVVQIAMLSGGALILLISVFYGLFKLRENQKYSMGESKVFKLRENQMGIKGKLVVEVVQIAMLSGGALILLISVFYGESRGKLVVEVVQIAMLSGGALLLLISVFYGVFKLRKSKIESKGKLVVEVVQIAMFVWWCSDPTDKYSMENQKGKLVVEVVRIAMLSGGALVLQYYSMYLNYQKYSMGESKGKLVVEVVQITMLSGVLSSWYRWCI
ncbi:CD36L2 [Mytilus edulis]|uniref:SCARB2 n=1 Tax=Mytilus edulis TaxID=6550 RepID=A0A8S3S1A0_MYTED|nr:CD36L2 [Mytilus edulis]